MSAAPVRGLARLALLMKRVLLLKSKYMGKIPKNFMHLYKFMLIYPNTLLFILKFAHTPFSQVPLGLCKG